MEVGPGSALTATSLENLEVTFGRPRRSAQYKYGKGHAKEGDSEDAGDLRCCMRNVTL